MKQKTLWAFLVFIIYQAGSFFYTSAWLKNSLPTGDFAGAVATVHELKELITTGGFLNWSWVRFCGAPNTLFYTFADWLLYIPFALFFEPILAVKIGVVFYLGLAGALMFFICRFFTKSILISLWAGFAYIFSPIYMYSIARAGHTNYPPFYVIMLLVFISLYKLKDSPTVKRLIITAVLVALCVWIDTERAFTTLPFMYLFVLLLNFTQTTEPSLQIRFINARRTFLYLLGSAIVAFLLASFFILPAVIEKQYISLFSTEVLEESRSIFGLNNPLYLFDRNGWLVSKLSEYLPAKYCYDAGNYYLGVSTIILAATVLLARKTSDFRLRFAFTAIFICICMIWTSSGMTSIYDNFSSQMTILYKHLHYPQDHPYLLAGITIPIICIIAFILIIRKKSRCRQIGLLNISLIAAFFLLVIFTRLFYILAKSPIYSHMRNPGFFMSALPPFLLTLTGTLVLSYYTQKLGCLKTLIIMLIVIAATMLDYYPYRSLFSHQVPDELVKDFKISSEYMKACDLAGRYLSRESYSPLADMHTVYTGRPTAWYWLNWSAPKGTHSVFMEKIYRELHYPETIDNALAIAGLLNVRFVTYNLTEGPLPPDTNSLTPFYTGNTYAVYQNTLCRDFVQFYEIAGTENLPSKLEELIPLDTSDANITYKQNNHSVFVEAKVDTNKRGLLVFSQSYYPSWSLVVDEQPVKIQTIANVLPAVELEPGTHGVRFVYNRPWYFYLSGFLTMATAVVCIRFYFRKEHATINKTQI